MLPNSIRQNILSGHLTATPVKELGFRGRGGVFLVEGWCVSLIDRKSRFLRKDAQRFEDILAVVRRQKDSAFAGHIIVRTAPVCRQARAWLAERGVSMEQV